MTVKKSLKIRINKDQNQLKNRCRLEGLSLSDYANLSAEISKSERKSEAPFLKVAVLSNFTLKGLSDCLKVKAFGRGIFLDVYNGAYSQWRQEIVGSDLYQFNPSVIFLIVDEFGPEKDAYHLYHSFPEGAVEDIVKTHQDDLEKNIEELKKRSNAHIVIFNQPKNWHRSLGFIDHKFSGSLRQAVSRMNLGLETKYCNDKNVTVFDFDGWLGHIGKKNSYNGKFFFLADMRLEPQFLPVLADELTRFILSFSGRTKKCLVIDLDNTIWGGIVGEEGLGGIKLAPYGEGLPYYLLQKAILGLYHKGVILAINSKNNEKDALEVLKKHPHALLKESHFAAWRINWQDKIANMRELAEELNVGLDSFVFIDDEPANREQIREFLPEVEVLDLGKVTGTYFETLAEFGGFDTLAFTDEDRKKGEMYASERKRKAVQKGAKNFSDFLEDLNLEVSIKLVSKTTLPRVAQLTQKTNQFNLTTRRYTENDLEKMIKSGGQIYTLSVRDKFGDYGLTGAIIVLPVAKEVFEIDTFLLSCRILGKEIEKQFLGYVINTLKAKKAKLILGKYIKSPKNFQTADFYDKFGFHNKNGKTVKNYELLLSKFSFKPLKFIKITSS